jgi:TolA-binding protein
MFNKLSALIMITALFCTTSLAQEQKGLSLANWLKMVQKKMERIVPKKIQPLSAGVAGVRGARDDASVKLYWKGKKSDEPVTEEEMKAFKAAISLVARGERAAAVTGLETFLTRYPDSALIPDAKRTLDLLKVEVSEEKKAMAK